MDIITIISELFSDFKDIYELTNYIFTLHLGKVL